MNDKTRLDLRIFELGLAESREKAKAFIMANKVYVNGVKVVKAGTFVADNDKIEVRGSSEFVSRGGYKLKKALSVFSIDLNGKTCMDIGASTGGFTDCMLQNGAAKVYSVDVGYGQLAWKLRSDPRVINLERTNVRYITEEQVPDKIDFASVDVSFISLCLVIPAFYPLLTDGGECVCLIKPQFEAGREKVGKKGVVRDKSVHIEVIEKIYNFVIESGFFVSGLDFSPIKGPEGNIEYLIHLVKKSTEFSEQSNTNGNINICEVVEASHLALDANGSGK
ncbi:MAG: TlyA family RNA methyltransferase [Clostridiales bacterium]|nr:TlyA family RNA methyltransferase [Clostridiales bacterium]